ncbi:uncharacterized protein LOC132716604 [Ruditapes philippinarum]|uniref:uncharacterized protein LOC132716604 n=1 Tax=Ruditapes philippinarum TaxID=129788 RepID=UPI00295B4331|nr:uncharacterized protein LOC132716604 [Ruditapes philippinarum]
MATSTKHDFMAEEKSMDPTTLYRRNMKISNKKKYNQYLEKQRDRSKVYRQNIKNDTQKMVQLREKAKIRQQKFRKRQREAAKTQVQTTTCTSVLKESKPRTRAELGSLREKRRESKKKYRKNMSSHKKAWVRKKDKERKQNKVLSNGSEITPQPEGGFRSKKTLYNVTWKARKVLPSNPQKYACVVKNLVQNTTPKKRQAVEDLMKISPKVQKCDIDLMEISQCEESKELQENMKGTHVQHQPVASSSQQESPVVNESQKEESKTKGVKSIHSHGVTYPKWNRVSPRTESLARNF